MENKKLTALEALHLLYTHNKLKNRDVVAYLLEKDYLPKYYDIVKKELKRLEEYDNKTKQCLLCKYHRLEKVSRSKKQGGNYEIHYCDKGTSPLYRCSYLDKNELKLCCENFVIDIFEEKEKQDKILKLLKRKKVDTYFLESITNVEEYNNAIMESSIQKELTKKEFDLLKEILL